MGIGFFFPLLIIQLILKLDGALFWISVALCAALAVFVGLAGIAVQCFVERKKLKETSEHLKKRKEQIKSVPDKIKSHKES